MSDSSRESGTLKWFNDDKGYGFITPEKGGKDVFIHITAVQKAGIENLQEGDRLEYGFITRNGRECADDIRVIGNE